ncbi:HisA/HisF-related TIM barrel protein, partial [Candidatus Symbiothrix dinenymphae]|uniref:imidazole glycerol phosphate synthase subunit HisF n=1 Tax=Candidatus Symbiothrix dinenymphae TaxID=467085 RepID=UPI0018727C2C
GIHFVNFRDAGDPVELGRQYSEQGADELVYLDITASHEGRKTFLDIVRRVAATVNIPFTVGGGINELSDVDKLLNAGADKVSINSAAIRNPKLIEEIANNFGSQVCVVAIDAKPDTASAPPTPLRRDLSSIEGGRGWTCYLNGGRIPTDKNLFDWGKKTGKRGGGGNPFTS